MTYGQLAEATYQGYVAAAAVLPDGRIATTVMEPSRQTRRILNNHLRTLKSREEFALGVILEARKRALSAERYA